MLGGCGRVGRRARRTATGAAGQRRARRCSARVADSEEFSGRLEATEYVELRPRVAGTIDEGPLHRRRARQEGRAAVHDRPAPVRGRGGARAVAARRRPGPGLELAQTELARAQTLLDSQAVSQPGVRSADLRHAHLAGRHPGRRGGAAHRPAQSRVHAGARADRGPGVARQHHRRQPRQRAVGADDDRRRRARSTPTSTAASRPTCA